jgi:hypothetical protein
MSARRWWIALGLLAGVYLATTAALALAMLQPPDRFGRIMGRVPEPLMMVMAVLPFEPLWNWARSGSLEVGAPAPDFDLEFASAGTDSRGRERLSSLRGRPVVLVFGSYT